MELKIQNLSKVYPNGVKALDDVSLTIPTGMFGLLGPNGAGKSTLMRIIATLQEPDSGTIHLGDIDVLHEKQALRKVLGYLPQEFGVYPNVSAEDLLHHLAALKGIADKKQRKDIVDAVLIKTNLDEARRRKLGGYSGGMKQRFGIAQALLTNPRLIIVDEPTAGLDPEERKRFLGLLREIGTSHIVIFSTHIVDDVRELCTHVAVLNKGKLLLADTPSNAITALKGRLWGKTVGHDELAGYQASYPVISSRFTEAHDVEIQVYGEVQPDNTFSVATPRLEDVYFTALHRQRNEKKPLNQASEDRSEWIVNH